MIGLFKERNSFQVPALLFFALVLKLTFIYHPHFDTSSNPGGILTPWLNEVVIPKLQPTFSAAVSVIIIFFCAIFANFQISSNRMFSRSNMLVALSVLLFTSLFPSSNQLSATTLLLPLLLLLFQQITRLYNSSKARPVIINIGMLMGLGYLLYHPFIWLLPCCFIGLGSMRPFRLAEWLLLLLGFVTPAYFLLSYEFLNNQWHPQQHLVYWKLYTKPPKISVNWWIGLAVAAIWLITAVNEWNRQTRRMLIQTRKNWYQLIFIGLFILPMVIFPQGNASEAFTLLAFPAGCMAANSFISQEKTIVPTIIFWTVVTAVIVLGWKYANP